MVASSFLLLSCDHHASIVSAPALSGTTATTCAELLDALPTTLVDSAQHSRASKGAQVQWGDPPLVLTCGVKIPSAVTDFASCSMMAGMQWFVPSGRSVENPDATVTVHTLGAEPVVRVDVPAKDRPRFDSVVSELGPVLAEHLTITNACE